MIKADLHCHSIFSEHPSDWFLQKLGARESYTDPFFLYHEAKRRGMNYVCITDHNSIEASLMLKERYPQDVITGVESTAYFPEDECKIHILIYGLNESQFELINHLRNDIYELKSYLDESEIAHSVAHASYSVNGKLKLEHLEKLILMFDVFESINGGRNALQNLGWKHILDNLTPNLIADLKHKHRIEPVSDTPWIKGYTGGSDDHAGLFIGNTYTQARAANQAEFLHAIRMKKSAGIGRNNDFHALAFTVYKIAYDFYQDHGDKKKKTNPILDYLNACMFENRHLGLSEKIKINTLKELAELRGQELTKHLGELIGTLQNSRNFSLDTKLDKVYQHISDIADSYFKVLLDSLEEDLQELNLIKIIRNSSLSIPGIFLLLPFFSTIKHMHHSLDLLTDFRAAHQIPEVDRRKRTLWFTDTLNDLNGVSVTLKQMGKIAYSRGRDVMIVSSLLENEISSEIPENFINLPHMYSFRVPFYESYQIKVPSVLQSIKLLIDSAPDQIIISTPGPVGLLGLLLAKMLKLRCVGIYHTDFHAEASRIAEYESASSLALSYEKWFYSLMDEIRVPTKEYHGILEQRGFQVNNTKLLRRGIETDVFAPQADRKKYLRSSLGIKDGITLLYVGRVSQDKSLDLLCDVYTKLAATDAKLNLVVAGNGPYLPEMKEILKQQSRVYFTGALNRDDLPQLYNGADLFIFPSVTDTYGMVILESLACGLPALVSNQGGPKELVNGNGGGIVVPDQKLETWVNAIKECLELIAKHPDIYDKMRFRARASVEKSSDWESILDDLLGKDANTEPNLQQAHIS